MHIIRSDYELFWEIGKFAIWGLQMDCYNLEQY